ncbi:MAG: DUF4260 domain-containing protein [Candidatus Shapirobacteria bacterium]|jgi:hypothetical protein
MIEILLRLEGAAIFLLSLWFYQKTGGTWLQFGILLLLPDITIVAYKWGNKVGAIVYNLVHTYSLTLMMMIWGWFLQDKFVMSLGIAFTAHIAIDRFLGFGLKHFTGFRDTHLGKIGN